jgi:hypothetical protein
MKLLSAALTVAMITSATAQSLSLPPTLGTTLPLTVPLTNMKGEKIGTATISNNRMYLRDLNGAHTATVVTDAHGMTLLDPNGKVLDHRNFGLDPSGNVVDQRAAPK